VLLVIDELALELVAVRVDELAAAVPLVRRPLALVYTAPLAYTSLPRPCLRSSRQPP